MSLEKKWDKDVKPLQPIQNENLTCRTCSRKLDSSVVECKMFKKKPVTVLKGGVCVGYKKQ